MEKNLSKLENDMGKNPENIEIIQQYTSLLEQYNNI
jgi:hypothetical protein